MHWATDLIGKRYERGAQGPDAFDCWGLVRHVLAERHGIDVPALAIPNNWPAALKMIAAADERKNWRQVPDLAEGCIVLMARRQHPVHVGIGITANGRPVVLHCVEPAGVLCQRAASLQAVGWGRLTYYRHHTWP